MRYAWLAALLLALSLGLHPAHAARLGPPAAAQLAGDTSCAFGARDCNRCVRGVLEAVAALRPDPTAEVRYSSMAARRLPPYGARLAPFAANDSHLEGIARLPLLRDSSWVVLSRARPGMLGGGGFFLVHLGDVPDHHGAPFGSARRRARYIRPNPDHRRTSYYHPVNRSDHPGGLQMIGQTLALAVSCAKAKGCRGRAFVQFDDLSHPAASETLLQRVPLFLQGEPHRARHATSVAVAKLRDGSYLMFVQGKDNKNEGWFYRSDRDQIGPDTQWQFIDYFRGGPSWDGRYQSTSLLTDCDSGKLYLLGTGNPSYGPTVKPRLTPALVGELLSMFVRGGVQRGVELLHLFELGERGGHIAMKRVYEAGWRPDGHGFCTFRAAASAYVTPDGGLALYCTTRKANTDLFGNPDSKLKLLEFAGE